MHLFKPIECTISRVNPREFPDGPVVKNLPANAGDMGSISAWGTKIPLPLERSCHTTTKTAQPKKKSEPKGKFWTLGNDDALL